MARKGDGNSDFLPGIEDVEILPSVEVHSQSSKELQLPDSYVIEKDHGMIRRTAYGTPLEEKAWSALLLIMKSEIKGGHQGCTFRTHQNVLAALLHHDVANIPYLKKIIQGLQKVVIDFDILGESKQRTWTSVQLLGKVKLFSDGFIEFTVDEQIRDAVANPEIFTLISLNVIINFNRRYSIPIYENCRASLPKGQLYLSTADLRKLCRIPKDKYKTTADLNRYVIDPSVAEINCNPDADIDVKVRPERSGQGGKIIGYTFFIGSREKDNLIPEPQNLGEIAMLYAKLHQRVKDESSSFAEVSRLFQEMGKEHVEAVIHLTNERIRQEPTKGPVTNPIGLFRFYAKGDHGKQLREKWAADKFIKEQTAEDKRLKDLQDELLRGKSEKDNVVLMETKLLYLDHYKSLPDDERTKIIEEIESLKLRDLGFKYELYGPLEHVMYNYFTKVKGLVIFPPTPK